jgi:uncharacterized protein YndB with AHSA1/START domain
MVSGQVFTVSARLPVSQSTAFRLFTEKNFLENWLTSLADVEPRLGGKYELFWDPGNPEDNSTYGCRITAFGQNRLLAFDWKGPVQFKAFMNTTDPLTHVTVFFSACDDDAKKCSDVVLVHSGWGSASNWVEARQWQQRAWEGAFDELLKLARSNVH